MKSSLLALLALCVINSTGSAQNVADGTWEYTVDGNGEATLVGISDNGLLTLWSDRATGTSRGGFEVPEYLDGYPLKTIGPNAFRKLAEYTGPFGQTAPAEFWGIDFYGVTKVQADAFRGLYVSHLAFYSETLHVDDGAFSDCFWLETITAGSVTRIGNGAFYNARFFRGFYSLNGEWEGIIFIPPTVRAIGGWFTFYECSLPSELTIPSGVTHIYDNTFFEADGAVRLILPDTVTSVGVKAFHYSRVQELIFKGSPPDAPFDFYFWGIWGTIYRLPGATGWSNTFGGAPVKIFLEKATAIGMSPALGGFKFSWSESGGSFPVNVERAPSPGGPWTVVSTANTNGQFTDLAPPSGSAFYRARATIP